MHDRRPAVLSAADAALWLDPALPFDQAEQLLRSVAPGAESFAWHAVDRAVGNVRNQGAQVAVPVVVQAQSAAASFCLCCVWRVHCLHCLHC